MRRPSTRLPAGGRLVGASARPDQLFLADKVVLNSELIEQLAQTNPQLRHLAVTSLASEGNGALKGSPGCLFTPPPKKNTNQHRLRVTRERVFARESCNPRGKPRSHIDGAPRCATEMLTSACARARLAPGVAQ